LLAENSESAYIAYVSQQNLAHDESDEPVDHPAIATMFDRMEGGRYHLRPVHRH
jgi:heat shock protein HspQ